MSIKYHVNRFRYVTYNVTQLKHTIHSSYGPIKRNKHLTVQDKHNCLKKFINYARFFVIFRFFSNFVIK